MEELAEEACRQAGIPLSAVTGAAIVGNTAMHHLMLGIDPKPLVTPPYMPAVFDAMEVGTGCKARILPNIAGFVGGDTVGCMVSTRFDQKEDLTLLIDIGEGVRLNNIRLDRIRSSFETVRRTENGWLCAGRADLDIPGEIATYFAARQLVKFLDERPDKKVTRAVKKAAKKSNVAADCRKKFSKVYAAMLKYAKAHDGCFPDVSGSAGLSAAMPQLSQAESRQIIYLGGAKSGAVNIPLLLDVPGTHADGFCVMYADGNFKQYKLERPGNCRRMISFLYTVHRWEIKIFQNLMKQAQMIDDASAKKE